MRFRPEEGGKNRRGSWSVRPRQRVLSLRSVLDCPELFDRRLQRIEIRSRNIRLYRSPVSRGDGSYCAQPCAAQRVDPEKGKLGKWKRSHTQSQRRRPKWSPRIGTSMFCFGRSLAILLHWLRASARRSFADAIVTRLTLQTFDTFLGDDWNHDDCGYRIGPPQVKE